MRRSLATALLAVGGCGGASDVAGSAAWRTVYDSTGDTIVARTTGEVPNALVRRLVLEQKIGEAEGSDTVTFGQVAAIAVTGNNGVFVFDQQGPSLKLFDSSGTFVRFVGGKGGGPGEFEQVNGMDVLPNESLVLWDASHGRINEYSATGDYRAQWRAPTTSYFTWNGLHTDREGAIVLTAPMGPLAVFGEQGFVRFDSAGVLRDTIRIPRWVDSAPQLTASSGTPSRVRQSMPLPFAPQLTYTWGWTGSLISGPSDQYQIYAIRKDAKPLKIIGTSGRVPVLSGEADDERQWLTAIMRQSFPNWSWNGPDIPAQKPAYKSLSTGYDGRIWVQLYSRGEALVPPEPAWDPSPGTPPPPITHYREPNVYDVFESNGKYVGRVRLERGQQIMRMRANDVWGMLTDSLGVDYVARWRIEPPFLTRR